MSFMVASGTKVHFDQLLIHVGYSNLSVLGEDFQANYIPGSRTPVYDHSDVWISCGPPGEWFSIQLDEPFWYNGVDNLIIDFSWPAGDQAIYVMGWTAPVNRAVSGAFNAATGTASGESLLMHLNGSLSLEPNTFGGIKATLGSQFQ